jgi:hypothetical protein
VGGEGNGGGQRALDIMTSLPFPRSFYEQLGTSDLTALSVLPRITPVAAMQLKVTTHASASVPLQNGEFCEYAVQMERFHGAIYFMRGRNKYADMTKLREKDIIVFEIDNGGFTLTNPSHHLLPAVYEVPTAWHDGVALSMLS